MSQLGLDSFQKQHEFLVGIDSDGCAFDSMEIKHKECFIPNFIKHMGLQPVSKYAREACEFTNLYSKTRGANRFPAYLLALDLMAERAEVKARGVTLPKLQGVRDWVGRETKLGTKTIGPEAEKTGDPERRVDQEPHRIVRGILDVGLQNIVHDGSRKVDVAGEIADPIAQRLGHRLAVSLRHRAQESAVGPFVIGVHRAVLGFVGVVGSLRHPGCRATGQNGDNHAQNDGAAGNRGVSHCNNTTNSSQVRACLHIMDDELKHRYYPVLSILL